MNWAETLASHRIFLELKLILKEQDPSSMIRRMNKLKLLKFIFPDIKLTENIQDLLEEIKKVIAWYNLLYLEEPFELWKLYWYGLTSQLDAKAFKKLTRDMGINSKMELQPKTGDRLLNSLFKFDGTNYQLYTLLRPYDTETLLYLMARAKTEKMRRLISFFFTKLKGEKALVDGKELLQMGLKSGPVFREVFDSLLEARLNNLTKTRDDEIRFVKNKFGDLFDESD